MRRTTKQQFVYFARALDMMKIGCSVQPVERLSKIGEWVPYEIQLVATVPGDYGLEAAFHNHFAADWSHLEWFRVTPEMERMVADINAGRPFVLRGQCSDNPKHIQKVLKKAATHRITIAENRAGRPRLYPERRAMRPAYLREAVESFAGSRNPPPTPAALDAIARYERELEAERAA